MPKTIPRLRRLFPITTIISAVLFILLLGLCTGCAPEYETVKAELGQEFSLRIGQTAQIESEGLSIRFNKIFEDTRRPRYVISDEAGEVSCEAIITYQGSITNHILYQPGLTESPVQDYYKDYRLTFSVEPYPTWMSPPNYRLILTVDKLVKAELGEEFTLRIGQTAWIEGEQLFIRFNGIRNDSRCPRDVTCIWAGEVLCEMTVTWRGMTTDIVLGEPGLTAPPVGYYYEDYQFICSVEPYPEAGQQISTADYRLILTVVKEPKGPPTK